MRQQQYEEALRDIEAKLSKSLTTGDYVMTILSTISDIKTVMMRPNKDYAGAAMRRAEANNFSGQ